MGETVLWYCVYKFDVNESFVKEVLTLIKLITHGEFTPQKFEEFSKSIEALLNDYHVTETRGNFKKVFLGFYPHNKCHIEEMTYYVTTALSIISNPYVILRIFKSVIISEEFLNKLFKRYAELNGSMILIGYPRDGDRIYFIKAGVITHQRPEIQVMSKIISTIDLISLIQ